MTSASASRIKTNKNCAFKYFIEYHLAIPESREGNIYTHKGSAVHLALEKWVNAILGLEDNAEIDYRKTLLEYYKESKLWMQDTRAEDKGGDPYPQEKSCEICPFNTKAGLCEIAGIPNQVVDGCPRGNFEEDLELVEGAINSTEFPVLKTTHDNMGSVCFERKIIQAELPFDLVIEGVPIRGVIDLVVEEDEDTIEIVDYKTGRSMSYNAAFKDAQVRIYGKVASVLFPQYKYVMVTLWFLKKGPVTVPITEAMNELTVQSLKNNYNQIVNDTNPQRIKSWLCNYCVGYDVCGKIKDRFMVDGKFRLPTILCRWANPAQPCYGSLKVEDPEAVNILKPDEMTYACKGHKDINTGGQYVPKTDVPDKVDAEVA